MADLFFRVHRSQLLPSLTAVLAAVDKSSKIPVLNNVLLRPTDGQLTLRGTDLDIEIETTCDLLDDGIGAPITIKAKDLHDIVRNLPETAEIDVTSGKFHGQVQIKAGRSSFSIASLPESDFPSIASAVTGAIFKTDMAMFTQALGKVSYAALKVDTGRVFLNGIHVQPTDEGRKIDFVAADGRAMALVSINTTTEAVFEGIILPLKTAAVIQKLFGEAKEPASFEIGQNMMRVECGGVSLFSRLIDGIFPPTYREVIPPNPEQEAIATVAALNAAVTRVSLVGTEPDKDGVKVTLGNGLMRVELYSKDGESAVDHLPIEYDGEEGYTTGFNGKVLADTLSSIKTQDVRIRFGGNPPNVVFMPIAGMDETFLISPMRARSID